MKTKIKDLIGTKYLPVVKSFFPLIFSRPCEKCDCEVVCEPMWKITLGHFILPLRDKTIYVCKDCIGNNADALVYAISKRKIYMQRARATGVVFI